MDKGFFGGLFDFDGDGELDIFEQSADFATFMSLMDEENEDDDEHIDFDEDEF